MVGRAAEIYLKLRQEDKSALASHRWATGHPILFDKTETLFQLFSWETGMAWESLDIQLGKDVIN